MSPKKVIKNLEEDFLYELHWDNKIDDTFVQVLSYEARVGGFVVGKNNRNPIRMAQTLINKKHGMYFSMKYFLRQVADLEKRYNTFGWMLTLPGVTYNESTNTVHASDLIWTNILKENPLAHMYGTYGENRWEDMQTIFAQPIKTPIPSNHEIIVVSSEGEDEFIPNIDPSALHDNIPPRVSLPQTDVVTISSNSSTGNVNVWDYLTHFSDSEGSLNTECSTANSRFRRHSNAPSPLKSKEMLMPKYKNLPGNFGVSSAGSNCPPVPVKGKGKGSGVLIYFVLVYLQR